MTKQYNERKRSMGPFHESIKNRRSIVNSIESIYNIIRQQANRRLQKEDTSYHEQNSAFQLYHHHYYYNYCSDSKVYNNINNNPSTLYSKKSGFVIRSLNQKEIDVLSNICQCHSDDWNSIYLMYNKDSSISSNNINNDDVSLYLKDQVYNCSFRGCVVLGIHCSIDINVENSITAQTEESSMLMEILKPGIKNNTIIKDSIFAPGARVYNNTLISDTFVGHDASVINCGSIHYNSNEQFIDEMELSLGPESGGGRHINVQPETTLVQACNSLGISKINSNNTLIDLYSKPLSINFNVILGRFNFVQMGRNVYISGKAIVQSCSSVKNIIMLPESSAKNSTLTSTYLQWKSSIIDSNVSSTILMECADIGPKSVITSTILGPDSHVSCGEVHCSLIGPNTNSHHQSLVISVLWPMGRGNVGYGSNIGSNHTGRLPDQECTAGEGIFWGLGCVIKFPVDLSRSCYSVVAAGVQLPPQTISMPFSLIMSSSHGKNEIIPGWLLHSSPYTVLRSEDKFKKRRKAKRHDFYCGWKIIRPSVIEACLEARNSLLKVDSSTQSSGEETGDETSRHVYTNSDLAKLGENTLTERGRKVGIEAYSNSIQRYALRGLYDKINLFLEKVSVEEAMKQVCASFISSKSNNIVDKTSWPIMPWEEDSYNNDAKIMEHQLSVLSRELNHMVEPDSSLNEKAILIALLKKTIALENNFFERVKKSKSRDDQRGENIIPDYNDAHVLSSSDPVVKMAETTRNDFVMKCEEIMSKFDQALINSLDSMKSKL